MFAVDIEHESKLVAGFVKFTASDLFSAYRLSYAFIKSDGVQESVFTIRCNGDRLVCGKSVWPLQLKNFFNDIQTEGN